MRSTAIALKLKALRARFPDLGWPLPSTVVWQRALGDRWLLVSALGLLFMGWIMVSSASVDVAQARTGDPHYYSIRHGLYVLATLITLVAGSWIPLRLWQRYSPWALVLGVMLLVVVLLVGREINGSVRWIPLGIINLQASEVAKLCLVIYLASYLVRHMNAVRTEFRAFLRPFLLMMGMGLLVILEPDYGALVVMLSALLGMMFMAGVRWYYFVGVVVLAIVGMALIAYAEPYRVARMITFTDPWAEQYGAGYQLTQSLIAFGRGHWFGLGLGNSVQKLFYLPEAHTDFVFAIVAEELGLFGALSMLGLFVLLVARIMSVARRAELRGRLYGAYLCYGIGVIFAVQATINIGVNVGALPTKGLTLPLVSYGGSSLLISGLMLGMVMRVALETDTYQPKAPRTQSSSRHADARTSFRRRVPPAGSEEPLYRQPPRRASRFTHLGDH